MPRAILQLINHCSECPNFRYINRKYGYTCKLDKNHNSIVPIEGLEPKTEQDVLGYMKGKYPDGFPKWCSLESAIVDVEKTTHIEQLLQTYGAKNGAEQN